MRFLLLAITCLAFDSTSASGQAVVPVAEITKIKAARDQTITVRGKISRASKSKGGINFINFPGEEFSLVMFTRDAKNFPQGEPADLFEAGQVIDVTGKIEFYKDKPQIVLKDPSQLRLAPGQEAEADAQEGSDEPQPEPVPAGAEDGVKQATDPEPEPDPTEVDEAGSKKVNRKPDPNKYFKD